MRVVLMLAAMTAVWAIGSALVARLHARGRRPERRDGVLVLRPPRFRYLALGLLALPVAGVVAAVLVAFTRRVEVGWPGLLLGAALVAGGIAVAAWLVAAEFRQRLLVDDFGVVRVGVATRRRVAWRTIEKVAYNPGGWFYLKGAGGARLWVPEDAGGAGEFATLALARIPPPVLRACGEAREALEQLAAAPA